MKKCKNPVSKSIFPVFLKRNETYEPKEIETVIEQVKPWIEYSRSKNVCYLDIPCAFDIETTSFSERSEKRAIMYEWSFALFGLVIIGRTWQEFQYILDKISKSFNLSLSFRLCIFVHNLAFEFQFMRKWLDIEKVFALDNRKPIYATCTNGIEFRCSYLLSGLSLEKIGENLHEYNIKKLVGDLDYSLIRHSQTPLTEKELGYCINDVKVLNAYIAELIDRYDGVANIPITKTGFVRKFCRSKCFDSDLSENYTRKNYSTLMKSLTLEPDEYNQLKRAFQGGFTHANPFYTGKVVENVTSYDFTSSYPFVMVSEQFPLTKAERITIESDEELNRNLDLYCCLFDIEVFNLESKVYFESYISLSRCWGVEKPVVNNGRIVSAEHLITTVTEQDYKIIKYFYSFSSIRISNFKRYKKDYLPTPFISAILSLYSDKTTLKGVEGKESEYMNSKEMLNSCYGMSVTDIVRDEIIYYLDEWQEPRKPDLQKEISKYNTGKGRFLFYPWGVWVTAYARRNLFTGIIECKGDYIYSDTDSIKIRNAEEHEEYFRKYNETAKQKLKLAMEYHKLPYNLTAPKTIKGEEKPLGVWDFDGYYSKFKTLGAKRYLVKYAADERNGGESGEYKLTVAGLAKKTALEYMLKEWGNDIFEHFNDEMYIPAGNTGKLTHTYLDEEQEGTITDYKGVSLKYRELSSVHLESADYSLSLADEYINYFTGLRDVRD